VLVAGGSARRAAGPESDVNAGKAPPVRLLTLTTLFPNAQRPRHGIFVANRLRRMLDSGRVDATVLAAVPWFPGAYRESARVAYAETVLGMPVRHPRYLHVPALGMRIQPDSLSRALLGDLRASAGARAFDLVDAHYFYPDGVAAARVADALGLPLVISARGSDINLIGDMPFARRRMLGAASRAQALIAVSAALAAKMAALGMPAERIHVLRNGVDSSLFAPAPQPDARRRLALDERARWVLGVGNLVHEKGFELLVRAVAQMPHVRLLLVGEGPLRNALRALGAELAPGRVEFRDNMPQAELRFVYSACDVLALPSLREGWPNVVLEAMSCGTPVVAAPVGGVPEMLGGDAPGSMVREREPHAWAAALERVLRGAIDAAEVRRHAGRFGWDDVVTQQCSLYERIVAACASRPDRSRG
jgi:glycosyltransferase involved in cell wall biosynthesis